MIHSGTLSNKDPSFDGPAEDLDMTGKRADVFQRFGRSIGGAAVDLYKTISPTEAPQNFEELLRSKVNLRLADGSSARMRQPRERHRDSLSRLYANLSDDDRRNRFFVPTSPERAMSLGVKCSSLQDPQRNVDAVVVTKSSKRIVAHAGYGVINGEASIHIVVDSLYRGHTNQGRLSVILFTRALQLAMLDTRVNVIEVETLPHNRGINNIVDWCMPGEWLPDDGIRGYEVRRFAKD